MCCGCRGDDDVTTSDEQSSRLHDNQDMSSTSFVHVHRTTTNNAVPSPYNGRDAVTLCPSTSLLVTPADAAATSVVAGVEPCTGTAAVSFVHPRDAHISLSKHARLCLPGNIIHVVRNHPPDAR